MMTFKKGLVRARGHIAFIIGLLIAVSIAWFEEQQMPRPVKAWIENFSQTLGIDPDEVYLRKTGHGLSSQEKVWAKIAWKYFENNYVEETGLVNSVDGYNSTTLWDSGSYVMGVIAARKLRIISEEELTQRLGKLLDSLARIPLIDDKLPNKAYNTKNLHMTNYNNEDTPLGIGWSTIDIARFGVPMQIIVWNHPQLAPKVKAVLSRWDFSYAAKNGVLQTASRKEDGSLKFNQEGRFGYEQYAGKSLAFMGLDVSRSVRYDVRVGIAPVSGQKIAYDTRLPRNYSGTHNAVLSEPYILEAVEYGLNQITKPLAHAVLQAQVNRFNETGILTAVSEDNIDREPYFVYYSVLNDMKPWAAFSPDGEDASEHRCLSLKAAMGWGVVFDGDYPDFLLENIGDMFDAKRGWYSGRYEADGKLNKAITANTNGLVLELLAYKRFGPLLSHAIAGK
ncbi:MAG: DUF3131 domain-containing protein [Mariprofundaceae bacterium]|nr:DUF3131 domain-containing protein [Mariprofundaceae bacterium]